MLSIWDCCAGWPSVSHLSSSLGVSSRSATWDAFAGGHSHPQAHAMVAVTAGRGIGACLLACFLSSLTYLDDVGTRNTVTVTVGAGSWLCDAHPSVSPSVFAQVVMVKTQKHHDS